MDSAEIVTQDVLSPAWMTGTTKTRAISVAASVSVLFDMFPSPHKELKNRLPMSGMKYGFYELHK